MNAIEMLKMQHREAEKLFQRLREAADDEQRKIFIELADALTVHALIEERHFYPVVRERNVPGVDVSLVSEHLQIKSLIAAILDYEITDPSFKRMVGSLEDEVLHHVGVEEGELFPRVERYFDQAQLDDIAVKMEATAAELESEGAPHEQVKTEVERTLI
jgi:hemerythrin superfamily protein